jgi:hypothetical protein
MILGTLNDFFLILFLYIFASYIYLEMRLSYYSFQTLRVSEIKLTLSSYN